MTVPHLAFLDAVRGIAVLAVIAVHSLQNYSRLHHPGVPPLIDLIAKGGQYGVQLFFIASAVTLAYSHDRRREETYPTIKFWVRRYMRIAPLYYFGILLYTLFPNMGPQHPIFRSATLNATFLHPYFKDAFNSIPPGGWSVGVEMQFYALLPFVLLFVRNALSAAAFLAASVLLCFAAHRWVQASGYPLEDNTFYYFWLPNQIPVFAGGLLLYHSIKSRMSLAVQSPSTRPSVALLSRSLR